MKNFKVGDKVHTKIRDIGYDHLNDLDGVIVEIGPPSFLPCAASIPSNGAISYLVDVGGEYGRNYFNQRELSLIKE